MKSLNNSLIDYGWLRKLLLFTIWVSIGNPISGVILRPVIELSHIIREIYIFNERTDYNPLRPDSQLKNFLKSC